MRIDTDKFKIRQLSDKKYIAIYGIEENVRSGDYDVYCMHELENLIKELDNSVAVIKSVMEQLQIIIDKNK